MNFPEAIGSPRKSALDALSPCLPAYFHLVEDFLTADECTQLEARLEEAEGKQAQVGEGSLDLELRRTRVLFVKEDAGSAWLWERLTRMGAQINADHFGFDLDGPPQLPQLGEYAANDGGHYGWHIDRGHTGPMSRRKLTISILLSDPEGFKGGDLHLNATGQPFQVPRVRGQAAIFPGYVLHRVTPVFRGVRRSLVAWFAGPDFR